MMDSRKITVTFYLISALVSWFLTRAALGFLYITFYQVRRLPGIAMGREALPVLVAAAVFFVLLKNAKVNLVMEEVISELRKVTWPSRDDVVRSTTVVIGCIVVASFILAGFDLLWGKVIAALLKA